ncbi:MULTISPECIES: hypothetical protein [unclassified Methylobacterium]|jgi:metal-responsive CopG/Arc/MetJ family transcriptional regulator|uniref:hypothetical protein n=1 Tax=unclassified Methylobacterium TaxID=2615210 RepID=UPI0013544653|nr:hypothetical protein [Methylobacterium sp. 2A]MWV23289.1 hypothetical protein [Methylobacterium sp. 2A]
MKNVTVTMNEALLQRARVAAARDGKSLSRFIAEAVEQRVGRPLTQREAIERFLAGPPLHVLDENGKAPTRDQLYDDD